jgi:hypothetical protein
VPGNSPPEGPILYLAAQGWYLWAVPAVRPRLHLVGSAALALVGLATLSAPPYAALIVVGASLTILAPSSGLLHLSPEEFG